MSGIADGLQMIVLIAIGVILFLVVMVIFIMCLSNKGGKYTPSDNYPITRQDTDANPDDAP